MRVALNLEQLFQPSPGGVGRYTAELARLLPEVEPGDVELAPFSALHSRHRQRVALRSFGLEHLRPVVLRLPRPLLYDAWHVLGRPALERMGPVDLVHAPSVAVPPAGRYQLVVTVHDAAPLLYPETYPRRGLWFHRRGIRAAASRADLVITVSQAAADELGEHTRIPADRIRIVPNGVDLRPAGDGEVQAAREAFGLDQLPYVLWLGSLEPRKNVATLVDAFARWAGRADQPHLLVLAGPAGWVEDRERVLAPARGLGERIRTIGRVGDDHLRALYRGADVFALPSVHEGFGIPVLEAMAQSTPVLAADIPALREVAGDGARLLPPRDVDAWATALGEVLSEDRERTRLGERGRARAAGFSWRRCAEATRAVYVEALSGETRAP